SRMASEELASDLLALPHTHLTVVSKGAGWPRGRSERCCNVPRSFFGGRRLIDEDQGLRLRVLERISNPSLKRRTPFLACWNLNDYFDKRPVALRHFYYIARS